MFTLPASVTREHLIGVIFIFVIVLIWIGVVKPCQKCKKNDKKQKSRNRDIDDLTEAINSDSD